MKGDADKNSTVQSFIATVITVIGIAWMTLTGLCTAAFVGLFGPDGNLRIGGICILPGVLAYLFGNWLRDRKRNAVQSVVDQE